MVALREPVPEDVRAALSAYDDFTAGLLARRGIRSAEAAEAFLSPSYEEHLHDPLLLKDMPKAAERLARAIAAGERIAVWSDYDCDGIPGGVILHDFLKKAGADFTNYIPHRDLEGYGVNAAGLEKLAKEGVRLVVTVDSGIVDTAAVAHANALGMEVIVTDHHLPGEAGLPSAYAVVNPKQDGETYPFRELCGAGLAWKLASATLATGRAEGAAWAAAIPQGWEKWLLDMAALATIADMVPLTGENRVIARYGLLVLRKSPRIGLQKLLRAARVNQRFITEDDVGFSIAPRVNAASRMGNPWDAFALFTTNDEAEADALAKGLEKANRARRSSAAAITRAVHERLGERAAAGALPPVIALGDPAWRPALLGLVANTVSEEYGRPAFLWGREGSGALKGSCRAGSAEVSVVSLMQAAPEGTFLQFGGHRASGGFTVLDDAIFDLEARLSAALAAAPAAETVDDPGADAEILPEDATPALLSRLERFMPFGMGNEKPVFVFRNMELSAVSRFGKAEEHLKLSVSRDGRTLEAVSFYAKRSLGSRELAPGARLTVAGTLERDQFAKGAPVRLRLVHIA